jgi:hypothetical protein
VVKLETAQATVRPRAGEPARGLLGHWNWLKKLNNYLNICRIGKSSEPRRRRPQDFSDAPDAQVRCRGVAQKWLKEIAAWFEGTRRASRNRGFFCNGLHDALIGCLADPPSC